jgi:hypothetical protein
LGILFWFNTESKVCYDNGCLKKSCKRFLRFWFLESTYNMKNKQVNTLAKVFIIIMALASFGCHIHAGGGYVYRSAPQYEVKHRNHTHHYRQNHRRHHYSRHHNHTPRRHARTRQRNKVECKMYRSRSGMRKFCYRRR